jgi:rSAM/selenodomain-associated transferase 1
MRRALAVVAKAPVPGRTKTRLVPPLSADEAAALYRGFLLDTLQLAHSLGWERISLVHPRGDAPLLRGLAAGVELLEQPREGLQQALSFAFEHHFAAGFDSVTLIGSDNPTLPVELIQDAQRALAHEQDLAIGPSLDGGYYLIGMRQPHLGVFDHIDWSTSSVYAQTLERAAGLNLQVHAVPEWYDVDEPADLERLVRELEGSPAGVAPNTRAALERYAGAPVSLRGT